MTIKEIKDELHRLKLEQTARALDMAISAEGEALLVGRERAPLTERKRDAARRAAEEFYAAEISEALDAARLTITPDDVLWNRRKPTVWAIATLIREEWFK